MPGAAKENAHESLGWVWGAGRLPSSLSWGRGGAVAVVLHKHLLLFGRKRAERPRGGVPILTQHVFSFRRKVLDQVYSDGCFCGIWPSCMRETPGVQGATCPISAVRPPARGP